MITVYLVNGEKVEVPGATAVKGGSLAGDSGPMSVVCVDAKERVLARFRDAEVVGYVLGPDQEG